MVRSDSDESGDELSHLSDDSLAPSQGSTVPVEFTSQGDGGRARSDGVRDGDRSSAVQSTVASSKQRARSRSTRPRNSSSDTISYSKTSSTGNTGSTNSSSSSFPTPFRCYGDFCGFELLELPRQPHLHPSAAATKVDDNGKGSKSTTLIAAKAKAKALAGPLNALQMLFPTDELAALNTDNLSNVMLRVRANTDNAVSTPALSKAPVASTDLHVITYKSIALAKANREHLKMTLQAQKRAEHAEFVDRRGRSTKNTSEDNAGRRRSSLLDSTAAQDFRHDSRLRVFGEMGDGVASYYRQVRVCSDCYAIYTLLDTARKLKATRESGSTGAEHRQQHLLKQKLHDEWDQQVASELAEKEKLYLRKPKGAAVSPSKQSTGAGDRIRQLEKPPSDAESPAVAQSARLKLGDSLVERGTALPVLLSPKELLSGSTELSSDPLSHSASMPVLSSTSSTSSGGVDRAATGKSSCFALPTASSSSSEAAAAARQLVKGSAGARGLDKYLRGENRRIAEPVLVEGQLFASKTSGAGPSSTPSTKARAKVPTNSSAEVFTVLLVDSDAAGLELLHRALSAIPMLELDVESILDPHEALAAVKRCHYDLVLCERSFAPSAASGVSDGLEFVRLLRQFELQKSITSSSKAKSSSTSAVEPPRRTTVICVTAKTSREDLQLYRDVGMDGCVGKPLSQESLHRTVSAALAGVATSTARSALGSSRPTTRGAGDMANAAVTSATEALAQAKREQQERKRRRRRRIEASSALSFPGLADMDARDDFVAGTFQLDAETAVPYCVLGNPELQPQHVPNTFFNLVVVHDLFDTWERLQILLQPVFARYHGAIQVLVWNYPGQAYTTWRHGALLNNVYHAKCLHALLQHLGPRGQGLWRDAPYYLMGIGNGGSIAAAFCAHAPPLDPNVRALLLLNAFTFVDPQLAQFLHDCLKVFATTPESRPDLPVYFHTRFLFSAAYLARVSTPLALNLYTAVMNPITLDGRRALCQGALANADPLRGSPDEPARIRVPLISICSAQNALVDASAQTTKLAQLAGLEIVDSIGKTLALLSSYPQRKYARLKPRCCVISLPGGHEVLQECKQDVLLLLEQLVTGYHEAHDAAALPKPAAVSLVKPRSLATAHDDGARVNKANSREEDERAAPKVSRSKQPKTKALSFEDSFIDNVLSTVKEVIAVAPPPSSVSAAIGRPGTCNNQLPSPDHTKWTQFQHENAHRTASNARQVAAVSAALDKQKQQTSPSKIVAMTSWDPTTPAFERLSSNIVYKIGEGSKIYPDPKRAVGGADAAVPELKEYMAWRVKRNQKRLQRMEKQARVIQRAFRAYYARTLLVRIKQARCAVALQRLWRAKLARKKYKGLKKEDWAARLLQRHWRGKLGRDSYRDRFRRYLAAVDIQRIVRGFLAVAFVARIRRRMRESAVAIQQLVRRYLARRRAFHRRRRRNGAMTIQRVFRGHIGRKRFAHERDKFLYSKTQSQGIAFGKQMLLEYKLFGTKLQSEVALLAKAKEDVEAQAEVLVNEICEFDEGIRLLEAEMHSLSRVEAEALAATSGGGAGDEQSRWALREQKMRLDREFTQMLAQIALRKEKLSVLEEKLQQLDRERLAKEEELKGLERKLVILLDEQQQELAKIKSKQQSRNQLVLDLASPSKAGSSMPSPGFHSPSWGSQSSGGAATNGGPYTPSSSMAPSAAAVAASNAASAFTQQQREEANSLMESTETMMKFGFMSMSMTYFSSMNMVRAMRKIGAHHMTLDSAAAVSNHKWPEYGTPGASGVGSPFGFSDAAGAPTPLSGFQPAIPNGSFPGQQPLQVAGWSVADVGRWLDTLALGQYKRAFADAATDGALLLHLNDDDLKNTLGMEHRLHRKKVLTSVEQLREAERVKMLKLYGSNQPDSLSSGAAGGAGSPSRTPQPSSVGVPSPGAPSLASAAGVGGGSRLSAPHPSSSSSPFSGSGDNDSANVSAVAGANLKVVVAFPEFCTFVRHGKVKQIKEALASVPERRFDPLTVLQPYSPGVGTVYDDLLEKSVFHINKGDENGNSPLLLAAQNNNLKVAQLLIAKGANPNHQNVRAAARSGACRTREADDVSCMLVALSSLLSARQKNGNTAGHYAMAYSFFDLGAWLLDPEKGGGRDDVLNDNGLTAYDGLS